MPSAGACCPVLPRVTRGSPVADTGGAAQVDSPAARAAAPPVAAAVLRNSRRLPPLVPWIRAPSIVSAFREKGGIRSLAAESEISHFIVAMGHAGGQQCFDKRPCRKKKATMHGRTSR